MEAKESKCYPPTPSAYALQYDHNNWAIYFRSTHQVDTTTSCPGDRAGTCLCCGFQPLLICKPLPTFSNGGSDPGVESCCQRGWVFSPLAFTDSAVCSTIPQGPVSPRQDITDLALGKTGPIAFLQVQWPPLPWERPFPVLWHFLAPLKWLLSEASFQRLARCKTCQHLIKAQNRNRTV